MAKTHIVCLSEHDVLPAGQNVSHATRLSVWRKKHKGSSQKTNWAQLTYLSGNATVNLKARQSPTAAAASVQNAESIKQGTVDKIQSDRSPDWVQGPALHVLCVLRGRDKMLRVNERGQVKKNAGHWHLPWPFFQHSDSRIRVTKQFWEKNIYNCTEKVQTKSCTRHHGDGLLPECLQCASGQQNSMYTRRDVPQ